jgi:ParB family chromosome partitioning protein|tara:strand:- start:15 stop:863 length:849 start_codon:yes stop_codon:yes gene_type:complete
VDTNKIKKGLGRGLSSLIGETKSEPNVSKLPISDLVSSKFQPRKIFEKDSLKNLENSIKERGIIQPIIVRKYGEVKNKYEIIAGERRWIAAQKAGLHEVPVVITDADDLKSLEFAIIENVQRSDLNPIEEAESYQRLIENFSYDQEKVSKFIGKSRSHIANFLRLLSLPKEVLNFIKNKELSTGHAKILVGLDNATFVASKIIEKKLSVRQAENFVRIFKVKRYTNKTPKDTNIKALEMSITDKIGLNVSIKNKKNDKGSIVLEYNDISQLNKIIEIIKTNY